MSPYSKETQPQAGTLTTGVAVQFRWRNYELHKAATGFTALSSIASRQLSCYDPWRQRGGGGSNGCCMHRVTLTLDTVRQNKPHKRGARWEMKGL